MKNKLFIFFILFLSNIYNSTTEGTEFKITIVNKDLREAGYITPVVSEDGYLYIITGEKENIETYQPGLRLYNRTILKFNISSRILTNVYSFNASIPFIYADSIMIGKNSEYLLASTLYSLEVLDKGIYYESKYEVYGYRRFLKQEGDSFYYGLISKNAQNNMQIIKMKIVYDDYNNFKNFQTIMISNNINIMNRQEMISCDSTEDNENILCIYISEDLDFEISVYNKDFRLLLNEKKESWKGLILDYFMKVVYFKDNSKFIIINSKDDYTIRLRYYKYSNNELIDQLSPVIDNSNENLDVDGTQNDGYHYSNDVIAVDSDKIFKIYTVNDEITLTIFQFYDHDSILFIKIYHMKEFSRYRFNSLGNPRLAKFRDTLAICLKAVYNNDKETTGYLFLNYPNSKDVDLKETNTIKIKDLISIENNIFNLNLKFRVLEIPKDFIFISKINFQEIQEGDILEIDDELILKQYRMNEGPYLFKYEGISIGDDKNFSSSKIFPKDTKISPYSEIYIEGREGTITLNFDHCLDTYSGLDYDSNLCTNEKPERYYLDNNDNIFKHCEFPCLECYGARINYTHMNCISCHKFYTITEDSNSCYNHTPDYYYTDSYIYRRCHPRCLKCITGSEDDNNMNCLACIYEENLFYRTDTHNCIFPNEFTKREEKNINKQSSIIFVVFFIILLLSIIICFLICLGICCKVENKGIIRTTNEINGKTDIEIPNVYNEYLSINREDN